jgi:hypothetical protein
MDNDNDGYLEFIGMFSSDNSPIQGLGFWSDAQVNTRPYIDGNIITDPNIFQVIKTNSSLRFLVPITDADIKDTISGRMSIYVHDDNIQTIGWINNTGGSKVTYDFFFSKGLNKTGVVNVLLEYFDSHLPSSVQTMTFRLNVDDAGIVTFGDGSSGVIAPDSPDAPPVSCSVDDDCAYDEYCSSTKVCTKRASTDDNALTGLISELGKWTGLSPILLVVIILMIASFAFISYSPNNNPAVLISGVLLILGGGIIISTLLGIIGAGLLISLIIGGVIITIGYLAFGGRTPQ